MNSTTQWTISAIVMLIVAVTGFVRSRQPRDGE